MATTTMFVANPVHQYHIDCVFDNISKQAFFVKSSGFYPIPLSGEMWCIKLTAEEVPKTKFSEDPPRNRLLHVHITRLEPCDEFQLTSNIFIENIRGKVLTSSGILAGSSCNILGQNNIATFKLNTSVVRSISCIASLYELPEDKLVVKAKFYITGLKSNFTNYSFNFQSILKDDLKNLYESSRDSDITFSLYDGDLKAHMIILKSRCPAFSTMFSAPFIEKETNKVTIEDIDTRTFDCFLQFLYTGEIKDTSLDTVMGLYYVANKYLMSELEKACSKILLSKLDEKTACKILLFSYRYNYCKLKNKVLSFLFLTRLNVFGTDEWTKAIEEYPAISSDILDTNANSAM